MEAFEDKDTLIGGGVEGRAVPRIKFEGNPLVEGFIVRVDALLDLASLPVCPAQHLALDCPAKVIIVWGF